ncbi:MAG TPA: sulfur reduction protein DsrE [Methanophagales archaeon]|nr:sulfur reduction protein DsrE [Methanophagales archaeon]
MSKILYIQSSGVDTPERLYAPFILATTATAMDVDAEIYFLIKGVTVVKKGEAEKIKLGNFPSLKEVMDQAIAAGVKLFVCEQSTQLLGIPRGDFIPEAKIVGAGTLNDLAIDADAVLNF